jgi:small conductance mechanosensitive channel
MASGNLPPSALAALRAILAITLWAMAVTVVVQTRSPARRLIRGQQDPEGGDIATAWHALRRVAAKAWTPVAIAYLTILLLVFLARETLTLPLIGRSIATMVLLVAAAVVQDLLIRRLTRGIVLSDRSRERLPQLEERLNHFLTPVGLVARIALVVVVVTAFLQIWNILPVTQWLISSEGGRLIQTAFSIGIILAFALLVWIAFATWVEARLNPRGQTVAASQRLRTLLVLARNAVSITLSVLVAMVILSELGINIGPLLAGAGVVGLAVGFGAQSLVKDIINGAFLQFENALNTGDVVTAGGVSGVVERLTIRSVGLRDGSGTFHVIPFSAIDKVANMTRDFGYHVAEIGVAYDTDIDQAMAVIGSVGEEMRADPAWSAKIIDAPDLQGVIGFADSAVTIRARLKCRAGDHWAVGREFSRRLKRAFEVAGIEIPFPQRILHVRQGTPAGAPPAASEAPVVE